MQDECCLFDMTSERSLEYTNTECEYVTQQIVLSCFL